MAGWCSLASSSRTNHHVSPGIGASSPEKISGSDCLCVNVASLLAAWVLVMSPSDVSTTILQAVNHSDLPTAIEVRYHHVILDNRYRPQLCLREIQRPSTTQRSQSALQLMLISFCCTITSPPSSRNSSYLRGEAPGPSWSDSGRQNSYHAGPTSCRSLYEPAMPQCRTPRSCQPVFACERAPPRSSSTTAALRRLTIALPGPKTVLSAA